MANDCYPDCDDYDDVEDGRQQLADYDLFVYEQGCKARALLSLPGANVLASNIAEDLASLVQRHATTEEEANATLAYMLRDRVAAHVITRALKSSQALLHQPFSRDGFIAIGKLLDAICQAFEDLLQTERAN